MIAAPLAPPAAEPPAFDDPDAARHRFGDLLRGIRARQRLSQEDLAVAIGVGDLQRISEAERGERRLRPGALARLVETLDVETRTQLVHAWISAEGELPVELHLSDAAGRTQAPHPLALSVAVHFAAWWPTLARGETKAARAALSVMRWALAKLGEQPGSFEMRPNGCV